MSQQKRLRRYYNSSEKEFQARRCKRSSNKENRKPKVQLHPETDTLNLLANQRTEIMQNKYCFELKKMKAFQMTQSE